MAAARRETVEQAEELQTLIKQEIERLKDAGQRRRLWPGASEDRTADLSHLATALKDASAARLTALGGIETLTMSEPNWTNRTPVSPVHAGINHRQPTKRRVCFFLAKYRHGVVW